MSRRRMSTTTVMGMLQLVAAIIVLSGLGACASTTSQGPSGKFRERLLWPMPPDQPRFEFAALLQSEADIADPAAATSLEDELTATNAISDATVIGRPSAIASRGGRVYVAEPATKSITVFDASRRKLFRFGLRQPNTLGRPQALALDDQSNVHVLDAKLRRVMIFDGMGLFLRSIALGPGIHNPVGLAVQGNGQTIYVVDRGEVDNDDHKVVALAPDGKERFRIGPRGRAPGQFNIPLAATVAGDGTLYVVDSGNFRIQAFDAGGKFKLQFGEAGVELGRFSRPRSIALDADGNIYVADAGFNNVQIFNPAGQLLMPLGNFSRNPGRGNYAMIAAIAVDEKRHLFVVDHYFKKIEVFRWLGEDEGKRKLASWKPEPK